MARRGPPTTFEALQARPDTYISLGKAIAIGNVLRVFRDPDSSVSKVQYKLLTKTTAVYKQLFTDAALFHDAVRELRAHVVEKVSLTNVSTAAYQKNTAIPVVLIAERLNVNWGMAVADAASPPSTPAAGIQRCVDVYIPLFEAETLAALHTHSSRELQGAMITHINHALDGYAGGDSRGNPGAGAAAGTPAGTPATGAGAAPARAFMSGAAAAGEGISVEP